MLEHTCERQNKYSSNEGSKCLDISFNVKKEMLVTPHPKKFANYSFCESDIHNKNTNCETTNLNHTTRDSTYESETSPCFRRIQIEESGSFSSEVLCEYKTCRSYEQMYDDISDYYVDFESMRNKQNENLLCSQEGNSMNLSPSDILNSGNVTPSFGIQSEEKRHDRREYLHPYLPISKINDENYKIKFFSTLRYKKSITDTHKFIPFRKRKCKK
jgi:hypothetical protein